MKCDSVSFFEGEYAKQSPSNQLGGLKLWMSKDTTAFQQLPLNGELTWVFRSTQAGLLIAKDGAEDFRSIREWTSDFVNTMYCNIDCLESSYPSESPTYPQPTVSPSKKPRYKIEVEHHLSGMTKEEWTLYEVDRIYVEAMMFLFDVPVEEIEIISVDSLEFQKRRRLKMQMTVVHASVSFIEYKRYEEFRDMLHSVKGRASLNSMFNFLLTDENSDLDNMHVQHMGIEGDFDMVAYFTTMSPSVSPSFGSSGSAMNAQEEISESSELYMTLAFITAILVWGIMAWKCVKSSSCVKNQLVKRFDDQRNTDAAQGIHPIHSNAILGSATSVSTSYSPEGKMTSPHFSFAHPVAVNANEGFVTLYHGEGTQKQTGIIADCFSPGLHRKATFECSDLAFKDSPQHLKRLPSQFSGISESDTDMTVYSFEATSDGELTTM